ncbi:MAG: hypothetical protein WC378_13255 [Opitutaceae bacterium]|jgi:hypothetical protein
MQLLQKKKPEAASPTIQAWHPNFRNYERLPDIKVVRTVFFINAAAITIAIAVAGFVGHQEYMLASIHSQIVEVQARIDRDKKVSDQAIALFAKFQAGEKKLQEIDAFLKARPAVSPLLLRLGETLPKNIALSQFDAREKVVILGGIVRGAPELASGQANAYVEQLRKDKEIGALFDDISLTNVSRDPQSGRLNIELSLRLKGEKPEKK